MFYLNLYIFVYQAGRCAYGLLIMAVYWMTEAIPIAATALIPIGLFPLLGVAPSKELCKNYFKVNIGNKIHVTLIKITLINILRQSGKVGTLKHTLNGLDQRYGSD